MARNSFSGLANEIEDMATDLDDEAHDAVKDELRVVEGRAKQEVPEAFGTLAASIRIRDDRALNKLQLVAGIQGITEYPALVEYGTGTYFGTSLGTNLPKTRYDSPDYVSDGFAENLQRWIDVKPVTGVLYDDSRDNGGPSDLAYAIASTIVKYGTKPHPFMRPAWRGFDRKIPVSVWNSLRNRVRDVERQF